MGEMLSSGTQENDVPKPDLESVKNTGKDVFLLGGSDYEMDRIRKMISRRGAESVDRDVSWEGADIKSYKEDIDRILSEGKTPVAIELRDADKVPGVVEIDHHNQNSEKPASISQVLERLGVEPSLVNRLAAGNDAGYYSGMEAVVKEQLSLLEQKGYTQEKLDRAADWMAKLMEMVRRKDRESQGVTEEMEAEAEAALEKVEYGPNGLVIVRLNGDRPSPVTDRLHYTWPEGRENLVVICNADKDMKEVWFFGNGALSQDTAGHFKQLKAERIAREPDSTSNEFHAWGGGTGFGKEDQSAFCGVVAANPDDVINYIEAAQNQPT